MQASSSWDGPSKQISVLPTAVHYRGTGFCRNRYMGKQIRTAVEEIKKSATNKTIKHRSIQINYYCGNRVCQNSVVCILSKYISEEINPTNYKRWQDFLKPLNHLLQCVSFILVISHRWSWPKFLSTHVAGKNDSFQMFNFYVVSDGIPLRFFST